ncbi:MAG: hypothetical protein ACRBBN_11580 [Methyloligellaceae bacterium]
MMDGAIVGEGLLLPAGETGIQGLVIASGVTVANKGLGWVDDAIEYSLQPKLLDGASSGSLAFIIDDAGAVLPKGYSEFRGTLSAADSGGAGLPKDFKRIVAQNGDVHYQGPNGEIYRSIDELPAAYQSFNKKYDYNVLTKTWPNSDVVEIEVRGLFKEYSDLAAKYSNGDLYIRFYSNSKPGQKVGTEMISTAVEAAGSSKVKTVSAQLGIDNYKVYESLVKAGKTEEYAVWQTPFGKSMKDLGFNTLVALPENGRVKVKFGFK